MAKTDRENRNDLRELRAELKAVTDSIKFINDEFEDMKKKLKEACLEREALRKDNDSLRAKCKENEDKFSSCRKGSRSPSNIHVGPI